MATIALDSPGARRDVALFPGPPPVLRIPSATREPFLRFASQRLEPVPRVPGEGSLSPPACRAHAGGALTVIEGERVWVLGAAQGTWAERSLPAGVAARDASIAPDGSLWLAGRAPGPGSSPSTVGREEGVLLRLHEGGSEVVVPSLSDGDRRRLAKREADEEYRRVDVEGSPRVVVASCPAVFDDLTEFALLGWDAGWTLVTTKDQTIRSWVRDRGGVTCYTTDGRRYRVSAHGAPARSDDLRPALRAAWPGGAPSGDLTVRAARAHGGELLVVAAIHDWRAPGPRSLQGSALFYSTDDCTSFACWANGSGEEAELLDAVWL